MGAELISALFGGLMGYAIATGQKVPSQVQIIQQLIDQQPEYYKELSIDTTIARDKVEFSHAGIFLKAQNPETPAGAVYVSLNDPEAPKIDITKEIITAPFSKFYVTNLVGTGTLNLTVGRAFGFDLQDAIQKVNVVAQTIDQVDVNIVAQDLAQVAVDLAAQSVGNLAVSIAAQTITNLLMSFNAQTVGVYPQPEWATLEDTHKFFYTYDIVDTAEEIEESWTPPAGKTWYITYITGCCFNWDETALDAPQHCSGWAQCQDWVIDLGGDGGFVATFPTPLKVVASAGPPYNVLWLGIKNRANHTCYVSISAGGYEV